MEAFSKLSSLLLQALETREPALDLLESFVDHWKSITSYYITTTDDSRPVRQTDIPWRLRQMLDILVYEEKQQVEDTGPCLEFLLQHKLLETLFALGKIQYPPGMAQQVFVFFTKLLSQIQKPLLQLVNIYRPVQKLIGLCGLPGSLNEKEEAQFLLVVCSRVKQEPHLLRYVLKIVDHQMPDTDQSQPHTPASNHRTETQLTFSQSESSACSPVQSESSACSPVQSESSACSPVQSESSACSPVQSESSACSPVQSESSLLLALLQLTQSQRSPVCVKAYQSLLLLAALQSDASGELLSRHTQLAELLTGRLLQLYSLLPLDSVDPGEVQSWPPTPWSSQFSRCSSDLRSESAASGHMINFFSWLDFLDHLMREAPQVLAVKLAQRVRQVWLVDVLQPQVLHTCEQVVLVSTSVLCAAVRLVQSWSLLDQLVHFLLRTPTLTELLLQRCDHISDQISLVSLSLVDELLQKPHRDILDVLVLTHLHSRGYLSPPAAGQEDRHPESTEDSDGLEEDPFFSDSLMFSDSQLLLRPPLTSFCSSSAPPPPSALGSAADAVNSFLCLVPVQVRSAQLLQEGGYESYVHDAHTLVTQCQSLSLLWDWPLSLPPPPSGEVDDFFEGHLLKVLFDRLGRVLEQPYELNLQVTAVLSRLSSFSHPLLHEYLLNPFAHLSACSRSLFSVLIRLMGELMQRIQQVSHLSDRLLETRKHLLGLNHSTGLEHLTLLRGVIVLEEFCKELAAIAFVKQPLDQQGPAWTSSDSPGPAGTRLDQQ